MRESLYNLDRSCNFQEVFNNFASIVKNWWTVAWNPTISNGVMDFDGIGDWITYSKIVYWIKSVVLRINPDSTTEDVIDFDGGTHSIEFSGWTITATWFSSPTIYVDWVATATITTWWHTIEVTTATAFNATALRIWKETDTYNWLMDYIRIYNVQHTASEVSALYKNSLYREPLANNYFNLSSYNWTINEKFWNEFVNTGVTLQYIWKWSVMKFNGSTSNLTKTTANYRSSDTSGSFTAWVKIPADQWGWENLWAIFWTSDEASSTKHIEFWVDVNKICVRRRITPDTSKSSAWALSLSLNVWNHIAIVSNWSWYTYYLNGVAETPAWNNDGSWIWDVPDRDNITIWYKKYSWWNVSWLNWLTDRVKLYSSVLSAEEVARDYNSTKNLYS